MEYLRLCWSEVGAIARFAYFLTVDKSNGALAKAEGLHSIYYPTPTWTGVRDRFSAGNKVQQVETSQLAAALQQNAAHMVPSLRKEVSVPLGKLIYELCVEFGQIEVKWKKGQIRMSCDRKGELLEHWLNRCFSIPANHARILHKGYSGNIGLERVGEVWGRLGENMVESPEFSGHVH